MHDYENEPVYLVLEEEFTPEINANVIAPGLVTTAMSRNPSSEAELG